MLATSKYSIQLGTANLCVRFAFSLSVLLLATAGALTGQQAAPPPPTPSACYASDSVSSLWVTTLQRVVTGSDTIAAMQRTAMALPKTTASKVSLVTNKGVCSTLLAAYQSSASSPPDTVSKVIAIQVAHVYFVIPPGTNAGEWSLALTFDSKVKQVLARVFQ